jgi:tetratricopeptide (TPR) repeat protein
MTRRGRIVVAVGCALVLGAAGGYFLWPRPKPDSKPVAVPPEVPASVVDPAVRAALTEARDKVLAEPQSGRAWGEYGWTFRAHDLSRESNACFAVAAQLDPQNPRWPYLIGVGNLLIAPDDVLPHLRTAHALASEPEHKALTRLRLAEALLERNDLDGAAQLFDEEVRADPQSPRAHFGLGAIAAARGDHRAAVPALERAAMSPFAHRKAAGLLAASYRRLGRAAEAEQLERAAARAGDDLPWPDPFLTEYLPRRAGFRARMRAAEEFEANGRLFEAAGALEGVARTHPEDQVLVSLGISLAKLGEFARAEGVLRSVVDRTPDHAVARYFLGIALYMQADRAWQAGDREWAKPRFEEAVKQLRRAAELKPDQGLAHLYAGLALVRLGDLPAALAECRAGVMATPNLADTHLGVGEVLVAMGKPEEAVAHLETAARLAPPSDTRARALLDKIAPKKP